MCETFYSVERCRPFVFRHELQQIFLGRGLAIAFSSISPASACSLLGLYVPREIPFFVPTTSKIKTKMPRTHAATAPPMTGVDEATILLSWSVGSSDVSHTSPVKFSGQTHENLPNCSMILQVAPFSHWLFMQGSSNWHVLPTQPVVQAQLNEFEDCEHWPSCWQGFGWHLFMDSSQVFPV